MAGIDIPIPECRIVIHQPTIKEIAYIGEKKFFTAVQCICINKEMCIQDKFLLQNTSNFQIFMMIMNEKEMLSKKEAVLDTLAVLFPKYKAVLTPNSLIFLQDNESYLIDDNNFSYLQKMISKIMCLAQSDAADFNPANDKAAEIANKLKRARRRVAAQGNEETNASSFFARHVSILTIGVASMSLNDCLNLTMYQIHDLVERYGLYVNWDLDLRQRLAGGKPEKTVDNWMKDIH